MCSGDVLLSSGSGYLGKPDRTCRPSTFWLMRYLRYPALCSPRRAMWVRLGLASSNVVSKWGDSPFCSNVQTPFGPLSESRLKETVSAEDEMLRVEVLEVKKFDALIYFLDDLLTLGWEDFCKIGYMFWHAAAESQLEIWRINMMKKITMSYE